MAYKKHTWLKGEKITLELLNNIENGIENAHKSIDALNIGETRNRKPIETEKLKTAPKVADIALKIDEIMAALEKFGILKVNED